MEEKVYKSKVAKWYVLTCIGMAVAFIGSIYLCYESTWVLLINVAFMGFGLWLMLDILFHTDYTIKGKKLHIRCAFLFRMDLAISKIQEISLHKSTILSSPALSAKRIAVRYSKKNWVYISPENQDNLIADIKSVNPEIIISGSPAKHGC